MNNYYDHHYFFYFALQPQTLVLQTLYKMWNRNHSTLFKPNTVFTLFVLKNPAYISTHCSSLVLANLSNFFFSYYYIRHH